MKHLLTFLLSTALATQALATEKFTLMAEIGAVWQNRNDTKISPDTGTRVAIDEFNTGADFHYRIEALYKFNKRHAVRLVYAPLDLSVRGQSDTPINFNGSVFSPQTGLGIRYQFNSYRASYVYSFWDTENNRDKLDLGFTLKVRDAVTSFAGQNNSASYSNVGVVPLIYFAFEKSITPAWSLDFNFDAAVASQGRASDVTLKVRRSFSEKSNLGFGVRSLEGGADNDEVFTFSWFTYAVVDLSLQF